MQPRFGGADGTADHVRDELERVTLEIVEDQDGPLIDRQPREGSGQGVLASEGCARIGAQVNQRVGANRRPVLDRVRRRMGYRDQSNLARAPDSMASGVHEDRPQPGLEGIGVPEPREISPDEHECLLDDLVGIDPVAPDCPNESPRAIEPARNELGERVRVTLLRSLDETALAVVFGHY